MQDPISNLEARIKTMRSKYPTETPPERPERDLFSAQTSDQTERRMAAQFVVVYPLFWVIGMAIFEHTGSDGFITFVALVSGFFLLPVFWCVCLWSLATGESF